MIYVFTRENQMHGHGFTDDVAIVRAINKRAAIKKFNMLYANVTKAEVQRISIRSRLPNILTSY